MMRSVSDGESLAQSKSRTRSCGKPERENQNSPSKLAIEIGKRLGGKILSADSMHVYKGIDILANKVTVEELSECPKHLIIENK